MARVWRYLEGWISSEVPCAYLLEASMVGGGCCVDRQVGERGCGVVMKRDTSTDGTSPCQVHTRGREALGSE